MVSREMPDIESTNASRKSRSFWRCLRMKAGLWLLAGLGATAGFSADFLVVGLADLDALVATEGLAAAATGFLELDDLATGAFAVGFFAGCGFFAAAAGFLVAVFFAVGLVAAIGFFAEAGLVVLAADFLVTGLVTGFFALAGALFAGVFLAAGLALGLAVLGWVRGFCFLAAMAQGGGVGNGALDVVRFLRVTGRKRISRWSAVG